MSDTAIAPQKKTDPPAESQDTSAGIVRRGPKTKRELELERRFSELEDSKKTLEAQLKEMTRTVDAARTVPSARKPGKSLWDELQDFLGWGD